MRFPTNQPVALRRKPVGRIYSRLLNDAIPGATAGEPSLTQSRCGRLTLSTLAVRLCDREATVVSIVSARGCCRSWRLGAGWHLYFSH